MNPDWVHYLKRYVLKNTHYNVTSELESIAVVSL